MKKIEKLNEKLNGAKQEEKDALVLRKSVMFNFEHTKNGVVRSANGVQ